MNQVTLQLITTIMGLVIQYGVPAVQFGLQALGKEEVTLEDIETLKGLIKPPEEY